MKNKGLSLVITTLIIILLVLVAVGIIWLVIQKVVLEEMCVDKEIPMELTNIITGKNFITFEYIWTGENNNLSLIASKYAPFKFMLDGVTYVPTTEYKDITPILLEENDTVKINHTLTTLIEFNHWSGENILVFRHRDNEKCIQEIIAGIFIEENE